MSNSENQNINTPAIKVTGEGTVTSAVEENPMEQIATEIGSKTAATEELPKEILNAAEKLQQSKISGLSIDKVDVTESSVGLDLAEPKHNELPVREDPTLTQSNKEGFNTDTIADPRKGEGDDGGITTSNNTDENMSVSAGKIVGNKTTGISGGWNGRSSQNNKSDMNVDSLKGKYELTGFSVQYKEEGSVDIIATEIREYYDAIDDAEKTVNSDFYIMKNGIKAEITRGAPIICFNERQLKDYIDETWKRI